MKAFQEKNYSKVLNMDEEVVYPETLLPFNLEVVSPVPPDDILEPSTSPEPVSSSLRDDELNGIQGYGGAPQNASSEHFDQFRVKSCLMKCSDLCIKDGVDSANDDSPDHPRIKSYSPTQLRNLQNNENLQHWTKIKDQFYLQPLGNEPESFSPDISSDLLFPFLLPDFNQDLKSNNFHSSSAPQTPHQQTLRNEKLYEYVKKL